MSQASGESLEFPSCENSFLFGGSNRITDLNLLSKSSYLHAFNLSQFFKSILDYQGIKNTKNTIYTDKNNLEI